MEGFSFGVYFPIFWSMCAGNGTSTYDLCGFRTHPCCCQLHSTLTNLTPSPPIPILFLFGAYSHPQIHKLQFGKMLRINGKHILLFSGLKLHIKSVLSLQVSLPMPLYGNMKMFISYAFSIIIFEESWDWEWGEVQARGRRCVTENKSTSQVSQNAQEANVNSHPSAVIFQITDVLSSDSY